MSHKTANKKAVARKDITKAQWTWREMKKNWAAYVMVAPYMLIFCCFTVVPVLLSIVLSFTDWDGFGEIKFIGPDNYMRMFDFASDPRFLQTLINTAILVAMTVPFGIGVALFLCYFLQKKAVKHNHVFRVLYYLPALMTSVAVGLLWSTLFDFENGTVNWLLKALGVTAEGVNWMGSGWGCRLVLALLIIWSSFGSTMLFFSSALTSIDDGVLDAAVVDGAGPVRAGLRAERPLRVGPRDAQPPADRGGQRRLRRGGLPRPHGP